MIGVPLTTHTGNSGPGDASQSDEAFQKLLLELSRAAFQSTDPSQLIRSFCTLTRAFFHASGAYYWSRSADGELVGTEAAADQAESFRGIRRRAGDASIAMDAVQRRRAFFVNHLDVARYPWLAECHAHAAMAAPPLFEPAFPRRAPPRQHPGRSRHRAAWPAGHRSRDGEHRRPPPPAAPFARRARLRPTGENIPVADGVHRSA